MDVECAFEVVVTDVETDAFDVVITKVEDDAFDVVISGGGGGGGSSDSKAGVLIDTVSGSIASFVPDATVPTVKGLTVDIEPVQSGSGDPSPDNIRPISGWDSVDVHISPTQDAADGTTYTIPLGQTVYGGTLDVTNGVLTVDRAMRDMGTMTWDKASGGYYSTTINKVVKKGSTAQGYDNAISSQYKSVSHASIAGLPDFGLSVDSGGNVQLKDSRYATAVELKSGLDGVQLCYELATPITIDLTPIEISVLTGQTNNVWADSGNVSVEYAADLKTYINNKIAAAVAALS